MASLKVAMCDASGAGDRRVLQAENHILLSLLMSQSLKHGNGILNLVEMRWRHLLIVSSNPARDEAGGPQEVEEEEPQEVVELQEILKNSHPPLYQRHRKFKNSSHNDPLLSLRP
jgi:hypothetical protein